MRLRTRLAATTGLLVVGLSFSPVAQARTSCSYAGPPTNLLTMTTTSFFAEMVRAGEEIVVGEQFGRRTRCRGGVPTVRNTDTIRVLLRGNADGFELSLGGGPLAPGATPEGEGESEIEVELKGRIFLAVVAGTPRADEFHWRPGGTHGALNVNPRSAGDQDVDVTFLGRFGSLIAEGSGGNDTIIPAPGAVVPGGAFSNGGRGDDLLIAPLNPGRVPDGGSILDGRSGNDTVTGSTKFDILYGGAGRDRVAGRGGSDAVSGGLGRDLLLGGQGRDRIRARDGQRDRIRCGSGRDRVKADQRDRVRGCELISRR